MMRDDIVELNGLLVHHGPLNCRAYVMSIAPELLDKESELVVALKKVRTMALASEYTKIIVKAPSSKVAVVREAFPEMVNEASIPNYYKGTNETAVFFCMFPGKDPEAPQPRSKPCSSSKISEEPPRPQQSSQLSVDVDVCTAADASELSQLYHTVFEGSYPFPVTDPEYVKACMAQDVVYFCRRVNGVIVGACAAEVDTKNGCAEMTDFATLPSFGGQGIGSALLSHMEAYVKQHHHVRGVFTISRAGIPAINKIFQRAGYDFGGLLVKNTHIAGKLEDMNVWHKQLQ